MKHSSRNPFCRECKIPMRKKRLHTEGEKRFFCPKCQKEI
jgi:formamidopyrimidine-DNA glycosylase